MRNHAAIVMIFWWWIWRDIAWLIRWRLVYQKGGKTQIKTHSGWEWVLRQYRSTDNTTPDIYVFLTISPVMCTEYVVVCMTDIFECIIFSHICVYPIGDYDGFIWIFECLSFFERLAKEFHSFSTEYIWYDSFSRSRWDTLYKVHARWPIAGFPIFHSSTDIPLPEWDNIIPSGVSIVSEGYSDILFAISIDGRTRESWFARIPLVYQLCYDCWIGFTDVIRCAQIEIGCRCEYQKRNNHHSRKSNKIPHR